MAAEENKALVRRLYEEVFAKRNVEALDKYIAADFVDHNPFPGQAPGLKGIKEATRQFLAAFPDAELPIDQLIAEGDKVVVAGPIRGTHKGEFAGIPATGKRVDVSSLDILRIANGKVIEHWGLVDQQAMLDQLGVSAAAPTPGMFARVSTIHGSKDKLEEALRYAREKITPQLPQLAGFQGSVTLVDRASAKAVAVTYWASEKDMRASEAAANKLREEVAAKTAATQAPTVERYEVAAVTGAPTKEAVPAGAKR